MTDSGTENRIENAYPCWSKRYCSLFSVVPRFFGSLCGSRERRGGACAWSLLSLYLVYMYLIFKEQSGTENKRVTTRSYACSLMCLVFSNTRNMQVRAVRAPLSFAERCSSWACLVRSSLVGGFRGRMRNMSAPLIPGQPSKSEFGSGPGHFPHPESDYQSQRTELNAPVAFDTLNDDLRKFTADKRTDPTDVNSGGYDENIFLQGNPDTFGPGPALVKQPVYRASGQSPQPVFRTGVTRQG